MNNQNVSKKTRFVTGLLGFLAYMNQMHFAKRVAKLVERFKLGKHNTKLRHRHTYGGPLSHSFATKKFVGSRTASRRARNFLKYHRYSSWARATLAPTQVPAK